MWALNQHTNKNTSNYKGRREDGMCAGDSSRCCVQSTEVVRREDLSVVALVWGPQCFWGYSDGAQGSMHWKELNPGVPPAMYVLTC